MTTDPDKQHVLSEFVRREVTACVSSLVSTLAKGAGTAIPYAEYSDWHRDLDELCDQALDLSRPIEDWEESASDYIRSLPREQATEFLTEYGFDTSDDESTGDLREALCQHILGDTPEDWARAQDLEPYEREIFEHWAVTEWLGRKLEAQGERVDFDFAGLVVWGRPTTGQAIMLDCVTERIYDELHADPV